MQFEVLSKDEIQEGKHESALRIRQSGLITQSDSLTDAVG